MKLQPSAHKIQSIDLKRQSDYVRFGDQAGGSMGFRFGRSVCVLPGVRLNFSKSGVSTSAGGHGATASFSKRSTRTTVGLPGRRPLLNRDEATKRRFAVCFRNVWRRRGSDRSCLRAPAAGRVLLIEDDFFTFTRYVDRADRLDVQLLRDRQRRELPLFLDPRSAVLGRLTKGTSVAVSEFANGWSHITGSSAGACWISSALLSQEAPASKPQSPQGFAALEQHRRSRRLRLEQSPDTGAPTTAASMDRIPALHSTADVRLNPMFASDRAAAATASRVVDTNVSESEVSCVSDGPDRCVATIKSYDLLKSV